VLNEKLVKGTVLFALTIGLEGWKRN